ncbi:MAG: two pore domain potassium channel family protein [Bacteroidales bacterium]|nr:two pore domain potassium channel family protein [Bacteroidales bacterium]
MKLLTLIEKHRFTMLFASLLALIVVPSFMQLPFFQQLFNIICLSLVFITSAEAVVSRRKFLLVVLTFIAILIFFKWLIFISSVHDFVILCGESLILFFLIFIISRLVKKLFKSKEVTVDIIIMAVSIYLLLGIVGGSIASILNIFYPDAYAISSSIANHDIIFNYYSFVTMTTTGYGDIVPIRPETQSFAILLGLTGQFYMTVTIAILVGKFISSNNRKDFNK